MSTLIIEGGHRLSGVVDVEGNKNAALPLMAATLLTTRAVHARQRAAHRRRRGDGAAAARPRRRGRGHRQHDAAHPVPRGAQPRARPGAGRTAARIGAAARAAAGPHRPRLGGAAGRRLPDPPHHPHPPRGARRDGRGRDRRARAPARGAARPAAGVDLPRRSVGHRHRDGAAGGGRGAGHLGDPPCRLRAARGRALRVPAAAWASAIRARAATRFASKAARRSAARPRRSTATTSRPAAGRSSPRSPAARSRSAAPARSTWRWSPRRCASCRCTAGSARTTTSSEPSQLIGAGRITTGLWPGFPSDLVSLVTVLATQADGATLVHDWMYELRLFALEQMSGMGADLFLCDPHRIIVDRAGAAARQAARQPRHPLGNGADRRGAGGQRREPGRAARDGRARLHAGWSSGCRRSARGSPKV